MLPNLERTSWAGVPADERRAARRGLLLEAGLDVIGTDGWEATTVRGVCERARLNARYFYDAFDDLDALLVAVYDRTVEQMRDVVLAAAEPHEHDQAAQTHAVIDATVRFVDEDRRRGRVLFMEAIGNEKLNRRRLAIGAELVSFVEQGRSKLQRPTIGETIDGELAAIVVAGFSGLLQAWFDGRLKVSRQRLVDDATALFLALGAEAGRIADARRRPKR